jgi:DNA mismatch repair protein MutS2
VLEIEVDGKIIKLPSADAALLEPVSSGGSAAKAPGWSAELHEEEGPSDRLNLLGLRVDEAVAEVERFIDHASTRGLSIVTVIHGLGTGALKAAVTELLKGHPLISATRQGEPAEGGAGVTVAELKK